MDVDYDKRSVLAANSSANKSRFGDRQIQFGFESEFCHVSVWW